MDIFEYDNYKQFLKDLIKSKPRGYQSLVAKTLNCQASYLIKVLTHKNELTDDQALKLTVFLNFQENRKDFLLLLVNLSRAASPDLKNYYKEKIENLRRQQENLKNHVPQSSEINKKVSVEYFSNADISVVHLATGSEQFQKSELLAERFSLSPKRIDDILKFLIANNLVERINDRFIFSGKSIYLEKDSPLNLIHQMNKRDLALRSLRANDSDNLHFSSSFTISKSDFAKIKKEFKLLIENSHKTIVDSPSEEIYSMVIDLFKVI